MLHVSGKAENQKCGVKRQLTGAATEMMS